MRCRFSKLIWLLLLLAPSLFAQGFSTRFIESALDDGLYPLAEEQIWNALSIRRTEEEEAGLTILLIRTWIGQGRFDDAMILSAESSHLPRQGAFAYWRARAQFDAGKLAAVFQSLENDKKQLKSGMYAPAALRLRGRAASSMDDLKEAGKAFAAFEKKFPDHSEAPQNLLDLANIQLKQKREKSAAKSMQELLKRFPAGTLSDSVRLLLARELIAGGGEKERNRAAVLLQELGNAQTALPRLRIAAWVELAALEQRAGRPAAAAEALLNAEALTEETALRVRQKAARANLLADDGKTQEALDLFDEAIEAAPEEELAADTLLQKAEILLRSEQFVSAEQAFQSYLNVTTDPDGEIRALSGKGWSLWEQKHYAEAAAAFERSAVKSSDSNHCATARMKAGDAFLAAGQTGAAYKNYHYVFEKYASHPLAARAVYQSAVALLGSEKTEEAHLLFQAVEADFPDSEFASIAALQQAGLFKEEENISAALDAYRRIVTHYTNATVRATALHQQGLIHLQFDRFGDALEAFRTVSERYPESPEVPQAVYMQGFCRYQQGDTEPALQIYRDFLEKYPDSFWAPDVLFWLSEHAYNLGKYKESQTTFLNIAARFPQHALSDDALFWAGNALLQQDSFLEAFTLYGRLAKEYPNSDQLLKTRFAQGEVLSELGEFPRAILAYEEVIKSAPDDPLADRARGRLGDCLFTLGKGESARYQEALEAYQTLYKRPAASFELKLQALYKIARCEDKQERPDKAFAHHMEVVYEAGNHPGTLSPGSVLWFTRAALEAAAAQERQSRWDEAINIYERIIQAGVPAKDEAAKRIEKIKKDN